MRDILLAKTLFVIVIIISVLITFQDHRVQAADFNSCDWMYQKAMQYALEYKYPWHVYNAESAKTWALCI